MSDDNSLSNDSTHSISSYELLANQEEEVPSNILCSCSCSFTQVFFYAKIDAKKKTKASTQSKCAL
jgi:hypothetical protein